MCMLSQLQVSQTSTGEFVFTPQWDTPGPAGAGGRRLAGAGGGTVEQDFYYNASLGLIGEWEQSFNEVHAHGTCRESSPYGFSRPPADCSYFPPPASLSSSDNIYWPFTDPLHRHPCSFSPTAATVHHPLSSRHATYACPPPPTIHP